MPYGYLPGEEVPTGTTPYTTGRMLPPSPEPGTTPYTPPPPPPPPPEPTDLWSWLREPTLGPLGIPTGYPTPTTPTAPTTGPITRGDIMTFDEIVASTMLTPEAKDEFVRLFYPERIPEWQASPQYPMGLALREAAEAERAVTEGEMPLGLEPGRGQYLTWEDIPPDQMDMVREGLLEVFRDPVTGFLSLTPVTPSLPTAPAPGGLTDWQRAQERLAMEEELRQRRAMRLQAQQAESQLGLSQQQLELQSQQQIWQQGEAQRLAEVEQRNYLARLAAQPKSWLEYAGAAGTTPAVQPWMLPLMPQQYAGMVAGEPIPEWATTPTGEGAEYSMAGLPALTRPSTQYQARMGPTALEQYYGYRQARTGARPEETQFRLWSQAPPGGRASSLAYAR